MTKPFRSASPWGRRSRLPRTWMVRHPDPLVDARVWIVDERAQDWHAMPTWCDTDGTVHGSPAKPWPREVYAWVSSGVAPVVIPMSSLDYVMQDAWWKGLVWNDVRQAWLLGWEPLNSPHPDRLWARTSLENRLLALEKTPTLRARLGVGPAVERYLTTLAATVQEVRNDPEQPALLVGVLEMCAEEWATPPDIEEACDEALETPSSLAPDADLIERPSRNVDSTGSPRVRFSLKTLAPKGSSSEPT